MKNAGIRKLMLLGAAGLLLAAGPAMAQSATHFPGDSPDNFRMRLGLIFADLQSDIKLSSPSLPGDGVDLTGTGLVGDTKTTFRGDGYWNFLGRSYLDFGFLDYSTDGSHSISKDIHFGDVIYKAGATVSGEQSARYIYAAYRYGFVKNENVHFGLSLGVSYATERAKLSASAGVTKPDGTVISGGASREREINVPVPLLGMNLEVALGRSVTIGGNIRAVGATIDPWSGSWVEGVAGINWYPWPNFGIGAAYEYQKIILEKKNSNGNDTRFDQRYEGPRTFVVLTF